MEFLNIALALVLSYLAGSIPFGLVFVRIINGKDLRTVESGRTGTTNAIRAAGMGAGLLTICMDVLKGVATGWIASWLVPGNHWVQVFAALAAILGHNYSIFLIEKKENGGFRLRGGAGGAPTFGGAIALWPPIAFIILPLGALIYLLIGYASVTTMSVALITGILFYLRFIEGLGPWIYALYGFAALIIVMYALRPNLARLVAGTERAVGLRAYLKKKVQAANEKLARETQPRSTHQSESGKG
jgi:glycerol-3-phosphate acyltransferase PlsY